MPFHADASKLRAGSIVRIEKPISSSGHVTHDHYFVVLTIPSPLKPGDVIWLAGISSTVAAVHPSLHVTMKWLSRTGGDPETGLTRICHACANFIQPMTVTAGPHFKLEVAAEHRSKFIRAEKLQTLWGLVNALSKGGRKS